MREGHEHGEGWRQGGRRGPRGFGGGRRDADVPSSEGLIGWLAGRLPAEWFTGPPEISVDRDEVVVVGALQPPQVPAPAAGGDAGATEVAAAEAGRIARFREDTRPARMEIARELGQRYGRAVAWGAVAGGTRQVFTSAAVPVMTRLRQPERQVLDTLVESGVARSRADALAWCVRLVGSNTEKWLAELREALQAVERVRATGPGS